MKKCFAILVLLCSFVPLAQGQVRLGLRGSAMSSVYDFEPQTINGVMIRPSDGGQMGYQLGVVLRLSIPRVLHIQPEINVTSRDYSFGLDTPDGYFPTGRISVKRLEMPVTAGFNIGPLRLFGGPVFVLNQSQESNVKDRFGMDVTFDDGDIALMAGVGIDAARFFFDIRYTTFREKPSALYSVYNTTQKVQAERDFTIQYTVGFFF